MRDARLTVSVIIPALNEQSRIGAVVRAAAAIGDEVIVSDGGSRDGTAELARQAGALVIQAPRGRGPQLHAGALRASGDVLLFLHADAELAPTARGAIEAALAAPELVGGNFFLRFAPSTWSAWLFTLANHHRRRWLRIYYGDSAIFLRRTAYDELGGFRSIPILEDYDFVRRLERLGRTAYVREVTVEVSTRRFERAPLRTLAVWTWIQLLYSAFDVSPERLARYYADKRS